MVNERYGDWRMYGKKLIGSREPENNIKNSTIFEKNTSKWEHLHYMGDNTTNTYIDPWLVEWLVRGKNIRTSLQRIRAAARRGGKAASHLICWVDNHPEPGDARWNLCFHELFLVFQYGKSCTFWFAIHATQIRKCSTLFVLQPKKFSSYGKSLRLGTIFVIALCILSIFLVSFFLCGDQITWFEVSKLMSVCKLSVFLIHHHSNMM